MGPVIHHLGSVGERAASYAPTTSDHCLRIAASVPEAYLEKIPMIFGSKVHYGSSRNRVVLLGGLRISAWRHSEGLSPPPEVRMAVVTALTSFHMYCMVP